jgi:hypothetical protein
MDEKINLQRLQSSHEMQAMWKTHSRWGQKTGIQISVLGQFMTFAKLTFFTV